MLGSLARKLRAFGLDTVYFRSGDDKDLLSLSRFTGRLILTSDRGLAEVGETIPQVRIIILEGRTDSERIESLRLELLRLKVLLRFGDRRCSICNGRLNEIGKSSAVGSVPVGVVARHRRFFKCDECGQWYWYGSHWKKLRSLEKKLRKTPHVIDSS